MNKILPSLILLILINCSLTPQIQSSKIRGSGFSLNAGYTKRFENIKRSFFDSAAAMPINRDFPFPIAFSDSLKRYNIQGIILPFIYVNSWDLYYKTNIFNFGNLDRFFTNISITPFFQTDGTWRILSRDYGFNSNIGVICGTLYKTPKHEYEISLMQSFGRCFYQEYEGETDTLLELKIIQNAYCIGLGFYWCPLIDEYKTEVGAGITYSIPSQQIVHGRYSNRFHINPYTLQFSIRKWFKK